MIVQSFRSVLWVGAVAGAALGCYMVSLRVATERASLESVETRILMAKRDIRALDTELVTRGRVRQLERWNVDVLALTAPTEGQFLEGEAQLAGLTAPLSRAVAPREGTDPRILHAAAPSATPADEKPTAEPRAIMATYRIRAEDEVGPAHLVGERARVAADAAVKPAQVHSIKVASSTTP